MDFDGDEDFAGLLVVGWDKYDTVEPWLDLTIHQERAVWQLIAEIALENCARFAVPDTVDDMFPE